MQEPRSTQYPWQYAIQVRACITDSLSFQYSHVQWHVSQICWNMLSCVRFSARNAVRRLFSCLVSLQGFRVAAYQTSGKELDCSRSLSSTDSYSCTVVHTLSSSTSPVLALHRYTPTSADGTVHETSVILPKNAEHDITGQSRRMTGNEGTKAR